MAMGLLPQNMAVLVLVDLKVWGPLVVQASSLPGHLFVNGNIKTNISELVHVLRYRFDAKFIIVIIQLPLKFSRHRADNTL
jgi:hypothetical protein